MNDQFYDIYDRTYNPFWCSTIFWLIFSTVLVGIIIFISLFFYLKMRKKQYSYDEQALKDLQQLKMDLENISSEHFYSLLTTVLKKYITCHYDTNVIGLTDFELINILPSFQTFPSQYYFQMKEIFSRAVTIKFACDNQSDKMADDLIATISFIRTSWLYKQSQQNK